MLHRPESDPVSLVSHHRTKGGRCSPRPPESGAGLPSTCRAPGPTPHTSRLTRQEEEGVRPEVQEVREGAGGVGHARSGGTLPRTLLDVTREGGAWTGHPSPEWGPPPSLAGGQKGRRSGPERWGPGSQVTDDHQCRGGVRCGLRMTVTMWSRVALTRAVQER